MGRLLDDSRGLHFKVPSCFWMAWLHSLMKGLWFPAVTAAAFTIRLTMGGHDKYFWPQYTHNSSAPANFVNYYYSQMQNINHRMHLAFGFTGYPYDDDSFHLFDFLLWLFEYEKDVLNQDYSFTLLYSRTPNAVFENTSSRPEKNTFLLRKCFLAVLELKGLLLLCPPLPISQSICLSENFYSKCLSCSFFQALTQSSFRSSRIVTFGTRRSSGSQDQMRLIHFCSQRSAIEIFWSIAFLPLQTRYASLPSKTCQLCRKTKPEQKENLNLI